MANVHSNIVLIGMMGAGKSTIGRKLALRLGHPFIDTDHALEEWTGKTITDLFCHLGEAGFREQEAELIRKIAQSEQTVIATGGGAVLRPENVTVLKERGWVILLTASPEVLMDRLRGSKTRPLLQGIDPAQRLNDLLEERLPIYREVADWEVITDGLTPDGVVDRVEKKIREYRNYVEA